VATSVLWLRRDLRLADHPALLAACTGADRVVPVFVLDDVLLRPAGPNRTAFLFRALADLERRTAGALRVVAGPPERVIPRLVRRCGAESVHVSSDHGPYGRRRDAAVAEALGDVPLVATGSPYGVTPGRLRKADGSPYRVFTPFLRAWREHGIRRPAEVPHDVPWSPAGLPTDGVPDPPASVPLPEPTEEAALQRWDEFRRDGLAGYHETRNTADGTSRLSPYLKWGLLHPRTLHAGLDGSEGARVFASELVWRDFYADVLWHEPRSARWDLNVLRMTYDGPGPELAAWQDGRTGYPYVDAAMRQLRAEGWLPNRARMVVASFLVKDLHLRWQVGARHFMRHLVDADLASNQHGWQWVAGTGTDASPYHRVFNPVKQGLDHDPDGDYVRRWVPELAGLPGAAAHEPWRAGVPGYPEPVVDHAAERADALARLRAARMEA
jgi:deoxyribodipyrimidine photo-lyase